MLHRQEIPARAAGVYTNGQAPAGKAVNSRADSAKRRRALRKLVCDLVAFTGAEINDLAATPRKLQRQASRITYRKNLSDAELDAFVTQVGVDRCWAAFDRVTKPRCTGQLFLGSTNGELFVEVAE